MRRRVLFVTVLLTVFIVCITVIIKLIIPKLMNGADDGGKPSSDAEQVELRDYFDYLKLLDKKPQSITSREEKALVELAGRNDAFGYKANLALGEKYFLGGGDPSPYFSKALELYETREIKTRLALSMINQERYLEAAQVLISLLPDKSVMERIRNLNIEPLILGQKLIEAKKWQPAAEYLKPYLQVSDASVNNNKLKNLYARALTESGDYKQALTVFQELKASGNLSQDFLLWYGKCLEMDGQKDTAKEIYSSLGRDGAYLLGSILEKEGGTKSAAAAFSNSSDPSSLWRGAVLWETIGEYEKAYGNYKAIAVNQGSYQDDAAYRAYILAAKNKDIDEEMLDIISNSPAWMELIGKKPLWKTAPEIEYEQPEFLKRAEWFNNNRREDMGYIELLIGQKSTTIADKMALSEWYLKEKNYSESVRWGALALKEQPSIRAYELAYPRHYESQVLEAAEEFDVDPYLLWALMREESRFVKDAVSRVGALGLLQLMPGTAKDTAARLKTKIEEKDLLVPDINIRLGAFYLRSMLNMYSGDIDRALAAYNGGPGNVNRWAKSKLGRTKQDFPAAVIFAETREYITKVKNSYLTYKWMYKNQ